MEIQVDECLHGHINDIQGEVTDTHGATVNTQSEVNDSEVTNRMNGGFNKQDG